MKPTLHTPAREAARRETAMHLVMAELAAEGRVDAAGECRRQLALVSAHRSRLAAVEHADARAKQARRAA